MSSASTKTIERLRADAATLYDVNLTQESAERLAGARASLSDAFRRSPHTVSLDAEPSTFDKAMTALADEVRG